VLGNVSTARAGASVLQFRLVWVWACWWLISLKENGKALKYLDYSYSIAPMMGWTKSLSFSIG
jgi:hypothetical protein